MFRQNGGLQFFIRFLKLARGEFILCLIPWGAPAAPIPGLEDPLDVTHILVISDYCNIFYRNCPWITQKHPVVQDECSSMERVGNAQYAYITPQFHELQWLPV